MSCLLIDSTWFVGRSDIQNNMYIILFSYPTFVRSQHSAVGACTCRRLSSRVDAYQVNKKSSRIYIHYTVYKNIGVLMKSFFNGNNPQTNFFEPTAAFKL